VPETRSVGLQVMGYPSTPCELQGSVRRNGRCHLGISMRASSGDWGLNDRLDERDLGGIANYLGLDASLGM